MATRCCWPPDSCVGIGVELVLEVDLRAALARDRLASASGTLLVMVGAERDVALDR